MKPMHAARYALTIALALTAVIAADLPSPALLVLSKEEGSLAIVDPSTRKIVTKIHTGEGPHEVAASNDGKLAFVSNYGARDPGNTISVISLESRSETRRFELGPLSRPHGLAFADGKLYFTAEGSKAIGRFNPQENSIDWLLGTGQNGTHMVLPTKDLKRIFTTNIGSDTVSIIEPGQGNNAWNETQIPVGKGPEGMDLSPDEKHLWVAHSRDGGISVIDVATKTLAGKLNVRTKRSNRLKFTPDGKLVLVSDMEGGQLVVIDAASRKEIKRVDLGRNPEGILIPPDGRTAYVAVAGENHVAEIDLAQLRVTQTFNVGPAPDGMAWVHAR